MKNLTESINEAFDKWTFHPSLSSWGRNIPLPVGSAKYLLIHLEGNTISPVTDSDLRSFTVDFDDEETVAELKKLRIGEVYDADGGINIYIRIQ